MEAESPSAKRLWLLSRPTRESIDESTPAEHVRNLMEAHQNDIMENIFSLSKSDDATAAAADSAEQNFSESELDDG